MSLARLLSLLFGFAGARVAGAIGALATQILLARTLSLPGMGGFYLAIAIASFFGMAMTGGYPASGVTWMARYRSLGANRSLDAFIAAARRDILVLAALVLAAGIIALLTGLVPATVQLALMCGLGAAPAIAMIRLQGAIANSKRRFAVSFVPDFFVRPVALLIVAAVLIWSARASLANVLIAYVALAWLVMALQALLLGRDGMWRKGPASARKNARRIWRTRAAYLVIVAMVTVSFSDIVVLAGGLFLDAENVAVIGVCIRLALLVGFFSQALQQFVIPDITDALAKHRNSRLTGIFRRANTLALAITASAFVLSLFAGKFALALFGSRYMAGQVALSIVLGAQVVRAAAGMNMHLLSLGGYQARLAALCAGAVAALGLVSWAAAMPLGAAGIALGVLASDMVWALGLCILARMLLARQADILAVSFRSPANRAGKECRSIVGMKS